MIKRLLLSIFAIVMTASVVAIAQQWPNIPIIGGASYCSSTVNATCVNTVPAGPALTGNETIPADTNLTGGRSPQTVKASLGSLGLGVFQLTVPLSGDTITLTSTVRQLIVNPAGTIGALTVNLPAATTLVNGQRIGLCGTQIVTAVTMGAGSGNTFGSTVTNQAMLVPIVTGGASCMDWIYSKTSATAGVWFRTQ